MPVQVLVWIAVVLMFSLHIYHGANTYKLADILKANGYKTYPKWSVSSLLHGDIARKAISTSNDPELVKVLDAQLTLIAKSRLAWILGIVIVIVLGFLQ